MTFTSSVANQIAGKILILDTGKIAHAIVLPSKKFEIHKNVH